MDKKRFVKGRLEKDANDDVLSFTESVSYDQRLYKYDIEGSIAHATMLAECKIITNEEKDIIVKTLKEIESEITFGSFEFRKELEDIHMNIEASLSERIGDVGRKLHTARSRNDQVSLDMRLWMRDRINEINALIAKCQTELVVKGRENIDVIMPGFTHLQHAQPVLLAHYLLAYVEMLERDKGRLKDCFKRVNVSPLGACALAGTTLPTDSNITAGLLGFDTVNPNSIDAVSDRDFCIEFVFCLSTLSAHLSRISEDWIIWSSEEFRFVDIDDSYCTGSSMMPQKKNPDCLELMRGKCGRIYGNLTALLTLMKGLPLGYNRDMQEDKEAVFNSADTIKNCLTLLSGLIKNIKFPRSNIDKVTNKGFLDATALAEYLVCKGLPFRKAHKIVGDIVVKCTDLSCTLSELTIDTFNEFSDVIDNDVFDVLGAKNCVKNLKSFGSSAPDLVKKQLKKWEENLGIK
ncbi:MAG: argininosuccinate lyase [Candidatus Anammoxibacter sp.]